MIATTIISSMSVKPFWFPIFLRKKLIIAMSPFGFEWALLPALLRLAQIAGSVPGFDGPAVEAVLAI
jgi:hypothetical protein